MDLWHEFIQSFIYLPTPLEAYALSPSKFIGHVGVEYQQFLIDRQDFFLHWTKRGVSQHNLESDAKKELYSEFIFDKLCRLVQAVHFLNAFEMKIWISSTSTCNLNWILFTFDSKKHFAEFLQCRSKKDSQLKFISTKLTRCGKNCTFLECF